MRLQEILKEDLDWGNGPDKDIFMSLKGLVNKNNGVWKSTKQRWFIMNKLISDGDRDREPELNKRFFGIKTVDGQTLVTPEALARWADYGSRSLVPVRYGFVVDEYGVIEYYKIGNKGNLSAGASPDPSKTKLEWSRPANADVQHLLPTEEELAAKEKAGKKAFLGALGQGEGKYLGTEGERMKFEELTLIVKKSKGSSYFGYNQSVEKFWNMYKDKDGNIVYHTGKEGPEKGEKVSGTATVKTHLISKKGDKVTLVIRPRFKLLEPETNEMRIEEITENVKFKWKRRTGDEIFVDLGWDEIDPSEVETFKFIGDVMSPPGTAYSGAVDISLYVNDSGKLVYTDRINGGAFQSRRLTPKSLKAHFIKA